MNEELEKTANEALKGIIENAASAKEFILSELPEVAQQLLMWEFWGGMLYIGLFGGIAVMFAAISYVGFMLDEKGRSGNWDDISGFSAIVCLVFIVLFALSIVINVPDIIKIHLAPKVYLLEYAANLVK